MELNSGPSPSDSSSIPSGWVEKMIGDVAELATGTTPPTADTSNYGDEFMFVSPADIDESKWIDRTGKRLSPKGFSISRQFPPGSVLFVCIGSTIGKCAMAKVELTSNQQINAVLPNSTFDSDFLYYGLSMSAPAVRAQAGEQAVPLVNKTQFAATKLLFPPISEQRAIATALSDVDALITGLERLIAKKRDIKQAAMQQLLTGQTRLPGFSGAWAPVQLGDLLDVCHGKNQHEVEVADGPYPILATGGQIGTANQPLHDRPSVLIGRKGTINKPQYMDTPFWTVDTLFYCDVHPPNSAKFLYYRFLLIDWMQYNEASGVPSLNGRTIERIEIECPDAPEQTAIATVLSGMDADLAALESRLAKTHVIKQGMMQELLTGRTRLLEAK